jgi:hypothetical protein
MYRKKKDLSAERHKTIIYEEAKESFEDEPDRPHFYLETSVNTSDSNKSLCLEKNRKPPVSRVLLRARLAGKRSLSEPCLNSFILQQLKLSDSLADGRFEINDYTKIFNLKSIGEISHKIKSTDSLRCKIRRKRSSFERANQLSKSFENMLCRFLEGQL